MMAYHPMDQLSSVNSFDSEHRQDGMMMDWKEIQTQEDIDALDQEICGFHDSCIVGMEYKSGSFVNRDHSMTMTWRPEDYLLLVSFETQFSDNVLELLFSGLRRIHLAGLMRDYDCSIMSGYLSFHDAIIPDDPRKMIVWADSDWFDPDKIGGYASASDEDTMTYIVAEGLKWRWRKW